MTDGQLRRRLRDLESRITHERQSVSSKLRADGFNKAQTDYFTTRAQTAPKQVLEEITANAQNPAVAGKVKRCVNLIKELNGKYWRFRSKAEKRGIEV